MASIVCAVVGGKGGVGRTTSAINLGAALEQYDYDTVVVDGDLSMPDMGMMLGLDTDQGVHSVLAGEASVEDVSVTLPGGLTVVPGEHSLDAYGKANTSAFPQLVEQIRGVADIVLIDTGTKPGSETASALQVADVVVLVTTADEPAVRNTHKTRQLAERLGTEVTGAVVTRVRDRSEIEQAQELLDVPVVGGIPVDEDGVGDEPLLTKALNSNAAKAYGECADRFVSLVVQETSPAELDLAFEDEWTMAADSGGEKAGADEDSPEDDRTAQVDKEKEESDEYTGGALPFG